MNTGRRWKLIMNKVSHHQRRPSRRPCSASTRRSWDSAAEWPEPWRKPHIPLGGCEARRAGRHRHPRLHPEDSHTQETKSSIRPCFIRRGKKKGKKSHLPRSRDQVFPTCHLQPPTSCCCRGERPKRRRDPSPPWPLGLLSTSSLLDLSCTCRHQHGVTSGLSHGLD